MKNDLVKAFRKAIDEENLDYNKLKYHNENSISIWKEGLINSNENI